jgi:hypothetical protein
VSEGVVQREIAEIQASMMMAKRFPRNPVAALDRILQSCSRAALAEVAVYEYARGGSKIERPIHPARRGLRPELGQHGHRREDPLVGQRQERVRRLRLSTSRRATGTRNTSRSSTGATPERAATR